MNFLTSKTLNNGVEMPRLGFGVFQSGGDTSRPLLGPGSGLPPHRHRQGLPQRGRRG